MSPKKPFFPEAASLVVCQSRKHTSAAANAQECCGTNEAASAQECCGTSAAASAQECCGR